MVGIHYNDSKVTIEYTENKKLMRKIFLLLELNINESDKKEFKRLLENVTFTIFWNKKTKESLKANMPEFDNYFEDKNTIFLYEKISTKKYMEDDMLKIFSLNGTVSLIEIYEKFLDNKLQTAYEAILVKIIDRDDNDKVVYSFLSGFIKYKSNEILSEILDYYGINEYIPSTEDTSKYSGKIAVYEYIDKF